MKLFKLILFTISFQTITMDRFDTFVDRIEQGQSINAKKDEYYLQKFPCFSYIQSQINEITNSGKGVRLIHAYGGASILKGLQGFFVKEELHRLDGAEIMRNAIKKYNYDLLYVPYKCAAPINNKLWVVSAEVSKISNKPFNLDQIKQLCGLVKKTRYWDPHDRNVMNMEDGHVALIDTKMTRFDDNKKLRINGLYRMQGNLIMEPSAKKYLQKEIEKEYINFDIDKWFEEELKKDLAR